MKLTPPTTTTADVAHTAARAAIGSIPVVGAAATELFNTIVTPPLEQRRRKWMADVGERLQRLEDSQIVATASLQHNASFIDTIVQASLAAIRTSSERKLEALRNAVINAALINSPDASEQQMFIAFIDSLSEWHLRILSFFSEKAVVVHYSDKDEAEEALTKTVEGFFPELGGKKYFYMQILRDLAAKGLIPDQPTSVSGSHEYGRTTEFGEQFLKYITDASSTFVGSRT